MASNLVETINNLDISWDNEARGGGWKVENKTGKKLFGYAIKEPCIKFCSEYQHPKIDTDNQVVKKSKLPISLDYLDNL